MIKLENGIACKPESQAEFDLVVAVAKAAGFDWASPDCPPSWCKGDYLKIHQGALYHPAKSYLEQNTKIISVHDWVFESGVAPDWASTVIIADGYFVWTGLGERGVINSDFWPNNLSKVINNGAFTEVLTRNKPALEAKLTHDEFDVVVAVAKAEREAKDWVPEVGQECEHFYSGSWSKIIYHGKTQHKPNMHIVEYVGTCAVDTFGGATKFRPIKTEREKFIEVAVDGLSFETKLKSQYKIVAGEIYDAIKSGKLKAPEAE